MRIFECCCPEAHKNLTSVTFTRLGAKLKRRFGATGKIRRGINVCLSKAYMVFETESGCLAIFTIT